MFDRTGIGSTLGNGHDSLTDPVVVDVRIERNDDGFAQATITLIENHNGKELETVKVIEGTEEEVKAELEVLDKELGLKL